MGLKSLEKDTFIEETMNYPQKRIDIPKGNLLVGMINGLLIEAVFVLVVILLINIF